jgi:predicted DNA-binding transcriptional regulator AlpA
MTPESAAGRDPSRDPTDQHRPTAKRSDARIVAGDAGALQLVACLCLDRTALASELLISRAMVAKLNASGRLPAPIHLGRRVLWPREEIEAWLRAGAPDRQRWTAMRRVDGGRRTP